MAFDHGVDGQLRATVPLPVRSATAFKLVIRHADGSLTWSQADNAYTFVAPQAAPDPIAVRWGAAAHP